MKLKKKAEFQLLLPASAASTFAFLYLSAQKTFKNPIFSLTLIIYFHVLFLFNLLLIASLIAEIKFLFLIRLQSCFKF